MALRSSNSRRRHTRTGNERSCQKGGFSTRLNPSAWVRAVHKFNSVIVTTQFRSMHIPVSIRTSNAMADTRALVDSGATNCFMSEKFIRRMKLGKRPLQKLRKIWNIDNTANQAREIMHYITLEIQEQYNSLSQTSEMRILYWGTHGWRPSNRNSHGKTASSTRKNYPLSCGL